MLFLRQALTLTAVSSLAIAAPHHHDDSIVDWSRLNSILDSIDNNVLHNVLHTLTPKFRDGVFSKDRAAIEHVHSENPVLASKIVYIAKRQDNSTTAEPEPTDSQTLDAITTTTATSTPTEEETTTTTPAPDSSSSTTAEVSDDSSPVTTSTPVSTTVTVATSVDATISAAVASQITESELPAPTTVTVAPSAEEGETPLTTESGRVVYSSVGGGLVTKTGSAVSVSFTRSTSTRLFYSTQADGTVLTSTSLVVVNAPVTETAVPTGAAGAAATSGDPGLQNTADRSSSNNMFTGLILGAIGIYLGL